MLKNMSQKTGDFVKFASKILCRLMSQILHIQYNFYKTNFQFTREIQGVFVKHYSMPRNKVQKAIFSFKVKVKATRSLTLVSFDRKSLVEYACQI